MGQPSRGGRGRECCGGACLWSHTRSRVTLLLLTVHLFTSLSAVAGADSNSGTAKSADPTSVDSGGDYVDREHERAGDVTTDDTVVEDGHCDAGGECSPRTEQTPPPPPPPPSEPLFTAATFIKLRAGHLTQEEALAEAKAMVGGGTGADTPSEQLELALMYYHHVSELNQFTDAAKTARDASDDVSDTLFSRMFADAPTLSYDPTRRVLQDQRAALLHRAQTSTGVAESSEGAVKLVALGAGVPTSAAFTVRGFASPAERAEVLGLHRAELSRNRGIPAMVCSGNGDSAQFAAKVREESPTRLQWTVDEVREAALVEGYDCLTDPLAHSWVAELKVCAEETRHYTGEYTALDAIQQRIADATGLPTNTGGSIEVLTLTSGCGAEQRTACTSGGQYSPRKIKAVTVIVALEATPDDGDPGGLEGGRPLLKGQTDEVALDPGDMLVVFNFGDGQDCDPMLALGLTPVTNGSRSYLVRYYDNVHDPTQSRRAFHYRSMDTGPPRKDAGSPRSLYQPTIVCFERYCRKHFGYGAMTALLTARNEIELVAESYDSDGDEGGDSYGVEEDDVRAPLDDAYWEE